jgi:hypothetical protein
MFSAIKDGDCLNNQDVYGAVRERALANLLLTENQFKRGNYKEELPELCHSNLN